MGTLPASMDAAARARTGVLFALTAAFLWGVGGAIAADAFAEVPPARVAEARAILATVVLVPYAWYRGRLHPHGRLWWFLLLGLNLAVVNVTFYWAVERLGVGPGATVQFLGPILVLAVMAKQGRPVGSLAWGAAVVAVVGVSLVTGAWALEASDWLGFAAGLAAALTFATYLLLGEHLARSSPPTTIVTWGFIFASLTWIVVQPLWTFPIDLSTTVWAELVFIGLASTALAFIVEFAALQRVASGIVGVAATSEPVFGATAAWLLLDQRLTAVQIVGGVMVVIAVASIQRWGIADAEIPFEVVR
jgi:drug/metabolite transporter (DMT)-like permease